MTDVNTIMIISDRQELVNQISQKLVLLRNLDKIKSSSVKDAQDAIDGTYPNALIVHCDNNNPSAINLVKQIKKEEKYKNLPILLINENCSRETIIEAYDSGITDVLFMPIIDYELVIRILWCLKQNEFNLQMESRADFMAQIGITSPEGDIYSREYSDEFLKNEIIQTRKYSSHACILLIGADSAFYEYNKPADFISAIKKSIRLNDTIIEKGDNQYYIYLQKTKLNGAYSVFERITNLLAAGGDYGASAGVVEVASGDFEEIKNALEMAYEKASKNSKSLIVASGFWMEGDNSEIQDVRLIGDDVPFERGINNQNYTQTQENSGVSLYVQAQAGENAAGDIQSQIQNQTTEADQNNASDVPQIKSENAGVNTGLYTVQNKAQDMANFAQNGARNAQGANAGVELFGQNDTSDNTLDKSTLKLYNQMYTRKLNVVIAPVFKKFEANVKIKYGNYTPSAQIGKVSYFKIAHGILSAMFIIEYDGNQSVKLSLDIIDEGQKRVSKAETVDFTQLDYKKVSSMLSELIDEFTKISNAD